jgi:aminopeptidase N
MVHELAHQWYGDSVAPETWSDLWLNEGHATWYEWTYGDEFFGGDFEFVARIRGAYEQGDQWRARYGPAASPEGAPAETAQSRSGALAVERAIHKH